MVDGQWIFGNGLVLSAAGLMGNAGRVSHPALSSGVLEYCSRGFRIQKFRVWWDAVPGARCTSTLTRRHKMDSGYEGTWICR